MKEIIDWFKTKNWKPLPFQQKSWEAILNKKSGLISVPTGSGKTYAAYLPTLFTIEPKSGIQVIYITPLRSLARDIEKALWQPITDLSLPLSITARTADTSASIKKKQLTNPSEILLTTPESLAILLSQQEAKKRLSEVKYVIIDEWHELLGSKRGVLLELSLARLKRWNPQVLLWAMSATLGNLKEAALTLVDHPTIIQSRMDREVTIQTVLPPHFKDLPMTGQLGLRMLPYVVNHLSIETSTLIFTNTRSQAERWCYALREYQPQWKDLIALHHSSIDKKERESIEQQVKDGSLKIVVCTSSLDLGVDFAPVDQVFQIGTPKSVARLIQRAGRSAHRPLTPCKIHLVPTHALELVEIQAYRLALQKQCIENRVPLCNCFDVLLQHLMSTACSGGFSKEEMFQEILSTHAYRTLSEKELDKCLNFLEQGGVLHAYPDYKKLVKVGDRYIVEDKKLMQRHRMAIGTIHAESSVPIKTTQGKSLGSIEEGFLAGLKPGDHFVFGGKVLELIQLRDLTAYVRLGKKKATSAAVWQGNRMPFSSNLGQILRQALTMDSAEDQEGLFLKNIIELQKHLSVIPQENELLIEVTRSPEGWHHFIYPFEGKIIHQGLSFILAHRLSSLKPFTFKISTNDYGFELLSHELITKEYFNQKLFKPVTEEEIYHILNTHELSKAAFREIARIAGLVFQGYPGKSKSQRQIQMSSGLIYDVFVKYDPENVLVKQAQKEVITHHFEKDLLQSALNRLYSSTYLVMPTQRFTPFSLPLLVERVSGQLSTESLIERIEKIKKSWKWSYD